MEHSAQDNSSPLNSTRVEINDNKKKLNYYSKKMKEHNTLDKQKDLCEKINLDISKQKNIITTTDNDGKNLLMIISELNEKFITNSLVEKILKIHEGAIKEVNVKDNNNSALLYAAIAGNTEFIKEAKYYILKHNTEIKNNNNNETAFILAVKNNKIDFLKEMLNLEILSLKKNKNLNISTEEKELSLLIAAENGYAEIVNLLVSEGIDINAKNTNGKTSLMLATENNHYEVISIMRKQSSITRISFTAACFCKMIAEWISLYQEKYHKPVALLEESAPFVIKPLMYAGYSTISTVEGFLSTVKYYKILSQYIPHPIENYIVTSQREKYFIDYLYGTSSDRSVISEHHSLGSNGYSRPKLEINHNNNPTQIRDRKNLSVVDELIGSNTNGSEHSMSSSSGIISVGSSQVNVESVKEGETLYQKLRRAKLESKKAAVKQQAIEIEIEEENLKKINAKKLASPSPIRQETMSTRSGVTSGQHSVPRLNLAELATTESTLNNSLSQSLAAFPELPSSALSHQNRNNSQSSSSHNLSNLDNNRHEH